MSQSLERCSGVVGARPDPRLAFTLVELLVVIAIIAIHPATHHNRSGVIAFADGHVETHHWRDRRTFVTAPLGQKVGHDIPSPGNVDLAWIRDRTAVRKDP